jgi:hypothetical protein
MATKTLDRMHLTEVMNRIGPDGNLMAIAEVLNEANDVIQDAIWYPANEYWSNDTLRRASLPSGTWRKFNEGVDREVTETIRVTDPLGNLQSRSEMDVDYVDSQKEPEQFRSDEDMGFVEGLGQEFARGLLYDDSRADPEKMSGLECRLDTLGASAYNVISNGNSSASINTSVYVVDWGPRTAYMAYPYGTPMGLQVLDRGIQQVLDGNSKNFEAYVTVFKWFCGLVIKNHKSIGRICNIAQSGASNTFDEDNLIKLLNRMTKGPGRRIYANEDVLTQMEILAKDKTNINYTHSGGEGLAGGGPVLRFKGVPVRQIDQITTEAVVA